MICGCPLLSHPVLIRLIVCVILVCSLLIGARLLVLVIIVVLFFVFQKDCRRLIRLGSWSACRSKFNQIFSVYERQGPLFDSLLNLRVNVVVFGRGQPLQRIRISLKPKFFRDDALRNWKHLWRVKHQRQNVDTHLLELPFVFHFN